MKIKGALTAFFVLIFWFYLKQASPVVTTGDSGEFITAAATLSLPHAPSFPLFTLMGRVFLDVLPWGSESYRMNVFSALTSAGTLTLVCASGLILSWPLLASLILSLLLATSNSFWTNSLVTEVFSLNILLCALSSYFVIKFFQSEDINNKKTKSYLILSLYIFGLALTNHQVILFWGGGFLAFLVYKNLRLPFLKILTVCLLFFCLGLSVYLFLPVRSRQNPPLNWGQPTSIQNLWRTVTRKDYGSLRLSLGDSPQRDLSNTKKHLVRFSQHLAHEIPWPLILLGILGVIYGIFKRRSLSIFIAFAFLLSGPFFHVLGNLPFTSQSDGIMGRFYILPVFLLVLGLLSLNWKISFLLPVFIFWNVQRGYGFHKDFRHGLLVWDYGQAMLRTVPPNSVLILEGGDDAFYSLATLHYVFKKRLDVDIHDRGGLIFRNIYGNDFRRLTKEEKDARRQKIERSYLGLKPIFYSTMESNILPGVRQSIVGFLMTPDSSVSNLVKWNMLCLRSLYPPKPNEYRVRALAPYFPYMHGRALVDKGDIDKALVYFRRAYEIGPDVDWLSNNLNSEYSNLAYKHLMNANLLMAEKIYLEMMNFNPLDIQAQNNYGVVLERMGETGKAEMQYLKTAERFPAAADPVFNLAVLSWKSGDWAKVVSYLEEVLRRKPDHAEAGKFLIQARQRLNKNG